MIRRRPSCSSRSFRLEDMGDDELRQIAGQVIEELDAQVSVDGEVRQVEAELLEPAPKDGH